MHAEGCNGKGSVRHERCRKRLEEQSNGRVEAAEVGPKSCAQRQKAKEESNNGEEKRNQVEREHEPAEIVIFVGSDELAGHVLGRAEVTRRVEWQRWDDLAAVCVAVVGADTTDREEGPAGRVADCGSAGNAGGAGLQEVDLVLGTHLGCAGEDHEKLHYDAAGEDEEGEEAEKGACGVLIVQSECFLMKSTYVRHPLWRSARTRLGWREAVAGGCLKSESLYQLPIRTVQHGNQLTEYS